MNRLLDVFNRGDKEFLLIQNQNSFSILECNSVEDRVKYINYELIKKRNSIIGTGKSTGEGVFDYRYGPVTGGIAECGIMHLYTYGERILSVEIDASYKHRAMEKKMLGKVPEESLRFAEQICGNFTISHSLAFSGSVETALGIEPDEITRRLRITALEMERIYNHLYVIWKLAAAAAQKVLASHLSGMFEEALRMNKTLFAMRYMRGYNSIGKVKFIPPLEAIKAAFQWLKELSDKFTIIYKYSMESGNFLDRLHSTSILDTDTALEIGVTGPTLRASGVAEDLRTYNNLIPEFSEQRTEGGDSLSRMEIRSKELLQSLEIASSQLHSIIKFSDKKNRSSEVTGTPALNVKSEGIGIGVSESPSGIIAYYTEIKDGKIAYTSTSTPSLFGFQAFSETITDHIFTDFPFSLESFGVHFADLAR